MTRRQPYTSKRQAAPRVPPKSLVAYLATPRCWVLEGEAAAAAAVEEEEEEEEEEEALLETHLLSSLSNWNTPTRGLPGWRRAARGGRVLDPSRARRLPV